MAEDYDIIIIGAGPGGYHAAIRGSQYGANVAIIEKNYIGGICTNYGCIPTKSLYTSATLLEEILEQSSRLGINIDGGVSIDFGKAVERKNNIVKESRQGIQDLLDRRKISILKGTGKIEGGNSVSGFEVSVTDKDDNKQVIKGKRVIIATGTKPTQTHAFNIDHNRILTIEDIMDPDYKTLPKSLIIIGGDYASCELAFIFNRFGSKITIIESDERILEPIDDFIINAITHKFKEIGIDIQTSHNVLKIEATGDKARVTTYNAQISRDLIESSDLTEFEAEFCLVSGGRRGVTSDIGFVEIGGDLNRNKVIVDDTMETNVKGIYSIGDVNDYGVMLANVANYEADIAIANILSRIGDFDVLPRKADYRVIPIVIFTSPEIGSVGIREKHEIEAAMKKGVKIYTGSFFYSSLSNARSVDVKEGYVRIIADKETDKILRASSIGLQASQFIADVSLAIQHGITATQLSDSIQSPTVFQLILEEQK